MSEWGGTQQDFDEQVELNELRRARGSIHDCAEAGCEKDPQARDIELSPGNPNPVARPAVRPLPSARETALANKHKRR